MELTRQSMVERRFALIRHYLQKLDQLHLMYRLGGDSAHKALKQLAQEWHQLQAQQQWVVSLAPQNSQAANLVGLFPHTAKTLLMQVDTLTAIQWVDDGLRWETDLRIRFGLATNGYELCEQRLDRTHGRTLLDEASAIAETLDDEALRFEVIGLEVRYYQSIEDEANQLEWAKRRLSLALHLGQPNRLAQAYHQLGYACCRAAQYSRAEHYLQLARDIFHSLEMRFDEGITLNALAINAHNWGDSEQLLRYGEEALTIFRQFGRRDWELVAQSNLALFLTDTGDFEKGIYYAQQGLAASVEAHSHISEYTAVVALMVAYSRLGLADEAHKYIQRAKILYQETPYQELIEDVEWVSWTLAHERRDWEIACTHAQTMTCLARQRDNHKVENIALAHWGNSLLEVGRWDNALEMYQRALALRDETADNPRECVMTLAGLSYGWALCGERERAVLFFDRFMTLMQRYNLHQFQHPFTMAWIAYRAAAALQDSRLPDFARRITIVLDAQLENLHEQQLRGAFLNLYSVGSLMKILKRA